MKKVLKKFITYGIAGGSAFVFDFILLYFLITYTHMHYLIAVPLVFIGATIINYSINHYWVFKGTQQTLRKGFTIFITIAVVGVLLTMCLMYMIIEWWHVHALWARIIAAGLVYIWSFSANFIFTFKEKQNVIK